MPRDHGNETAVGNPPPELLAELQGHPLQDYVDTVRAVVFDLKTNLESNRDHTKTTGKERRGSERPAPVKYTAGVRAELLDTNEWLIQRIAHSLFIKNQFS